MKKITLLNGSNDPILELLKTKFSVTSNNSLDIETGVAMVFDFNFGNEDFDESVIDKAIENKSPIILLNTDGEAMSEVFGHGTNERIMVVYCYENYNYFIPIGNGSETSENSESGYIIDDSVDVTKSKIQYSEYDIEAINLLSELTSAESYQSKKEMNSVGSDLPINLPKGQFKLWFRESKRLITDLIEGQVARNEIIYECLLVASHNPNAKFLRIRVKGAGFSPGDGKDIRFDEPRNRGFFQDQIDINLEPMHDRVSSYESSPKNINNVTSYTSSTSFKVGVDIGRHPNFKPEYTVSNSMSRDVSDFNVTNRSSGAKSSWRYNLSITEHDIKNIFDPYPRSVGSPPYVKEIPTLAKHNLQPAFQGVWVVNNGKDFNEKVPVVMNWTIRYLRAWVTIGFLGATWRWDYRAIPRGHGWWKDRNPYWINFSSVRT